VVSGNPEWGTATATPPDNPQPTYEYWTISWQAAPGYVVEKITSNKSDQEWIPWQDSYNLSRHGGRHGIHRLVQGAGDHLPRDADCAVIKSNYSSFGSTTQIPTSRPSPISGRMADVYFPIYSNSRINNVTATASAVCATRP
jgi:hypothetical protein